MSRRIKNSQKESGCALMKWWGISMKIMKKVWKIVGEKKHKIKKI